VSLITVLVCDCVTLITVLVCDCVRGSCHVYSSNDPLGSSVALPCLALARTRAGSIFRS
jgi:hypothetical protein